MSVAEIDHGRGTFVLVGCGAAKAAERREARNLYTSTYFQLKREFAEAATNWITDKTEQGNGWMILSAEHGIYPPRLELDPYDTTVDDLGGEELDRWARRVRGSLIDWLRCPFSAEDPDDSPCGTLIVLAGQSYVDPLLDREVFSSAGRHSYTVPVTPQFPFRDLDLGGIGEQMAWLKEAAPVVDATPPKRAELNTYGAGYDRQQAPWQWDRDTIDVDRTEQASLFAFEDVDDRHIATQQQSLSTATPKPQTQS